MKCLTLNTHSWIESAPFEKLQHLATHILNEDYDAIALQEVNQTMTESIIPNTQLKHYFSTSEDCLIKKDNFAQLLQKKLQENGQEYHWSYFPSHIGYDKYDEGVAILSKYPILAANNLLLSSEHDYNDFRTRYALGVNVATPNQNIWVYSLHFSWWYNGQNQTNFNFEWQKLTDHLTRNTNKEFILLMGDFNNPAHLNAEGYELVTSSGWHDSYQLALEKTGQNTVTKKIDGWENNEDGIRIDYIFLSDKKSITKYEIVLNGQNSPIISDHFGIKIEFTL